MPLTLRAPPSLILQLCRLDGQLDVDGMLDQVNGLIADRDVPFMPIETGDQTAYLVMLDSDEKGALAGWGWPPPPDGPIERLKVSA